MTTAVDSFFNYVAHSFFAKVLVSIFAICIATRVITARKTSSPSSTIAPYWLPYFGHFFHIFYSWRSFLSSNAKYIHNGYLSVYVIGRNATIILSPSLTNSLFSNSQSNSHSPSSLHFYLLRNVFGAPSNTKKFFEHTSSSLPDLLPQTSLSTQVIVGLISSRLPDLVSFNSHVVDQFPWERPSYPKTMPHPYSLDSTRQAARVPFVTLITHFIGHALGTAIMGEDFMEQYPQVLDDLADLDAGFKYLALGLPRWVPPLSVTSAHIARKRLLTILGHIQTALDLKARGEDPDELWGDMIEDLSEGVRERSHVLREKGAPVTFRASIDLAELWSTYAQATTLTNWMLIHIWRTSDLWAKIKIETSSFTKIKLGAKIMALSGSHRIDIDEAGLKSSCPLLISCFVECVKQYQWPKAAMYCTEDVYLGADQHQSVHLEAGSFVVCGGSPLDFDLNAFERIATSAEGSSTDALHNGIHMSLDSISVNDTVTNAVLTTVAGIITLWEIMPTSTRSIAVPAANSSSPCARPASAFNVNLAQACLID